MQLMKHQSEGVTWLIENSGGILADEMGTGKTIQALAFGKWLYHARKVNHILVVCPASLLKNWEQETIKYYGFKPYIHHGPNRNKRKPLASVVVVSTYETFVRDLEVFKAMCPPDETLLVVDEAHYIKNKDSKRTQALTEFGAALRLPMTGTPIANKPEDAYALINFFDPTLTNCWEWWQDTFLITQIREISVKGKRRWIPEIVGYKNHEMLSNILKSCMLRRLRKDCLDLPRKQVQHIPYDAECTLYRNVLDQVELNDDSMLVKVTQLLQSLSGVDPFEESIRWTPPPKLGVLECLISSAGSHVIVWHKFVKSLNPTLKYFREKGHAVYRHTGEQSQADRTSQLNSWKANGGILFATIRSAGVGLTLIDASTAIFYELELSPSDNFQAEDRVYRVGQTRPVNIYYLYGAGTVEQGISVLLKRKAHTTQALVDTVTPDELREIYEYSYKVKLYG